VRRRSSTNTSVASTLIVDTSVVFATLDTDDRDHQKCKALLESSNVVTTVPAPVIIETGLLLKARRRADEIHRLLASVEDQSVLVVELDYKDYSRVRELVRRYADLPLDVVDASVVAIAERLEETVIATLDHRHFSVVRPAHIPAFTLVPSLD
jgi:hypothetical protein